jgi:hypothetical protein
MMGRKPGRANVRLVTMLNKVNQTDPEWYFAIETKLTLARF